jgi:HEPN domain-containing protein
MEGNMEKNKSLLDGAKTDLKVCGLILTSYEDDLSINLAAYHLQQAVEKALKFRINAMGEKYPMTHNIGQLTAVLSKMNDSPPEWLEDEADRITEYEQKARSVMGYAASRKKLQALLAKVEELIQKFEPKPEK